MEKNLGSQVLKSDKGIRWVVVVGADGKVLESKTREGLKILVPESSMKKTILQLVIIWGLAEELGKKLGSPSRTVIHFELVDLILLKLKNYFIGLSVDKNVKSDDLAKSLKANLEVKV